jgi:predicted CXXCH cytochrome family protein
VNTGPLKYLFLCTAVALTSAVGAASAEVDNPHWTGLHCLECHSSKEGGALRFNGDIIQVCNRCHESATATRERHPSGLALTERMKESTSFRWPLRDGQITCLSCHEVKEQMYKQPAMQILNPGFLRGGPYDRMEDFCFSCHVKQDFKKENPHYQIDAGGNLLQQKCFFCHEKTPNAETAAGPDSVGLKDDHADICIGCHPAQRSKHPARSDHMVEMEGEMLSRHERGTRAAGTDLPLLKGKIVCETCHNPHQEGVIKRMAAQAGSAQKAFLRLDGGGDLCETCHSDKSFHAAEGPASEVQPPVLAKNFEHKPVAEKKCKACHTMRSEETGKQRIMMLCFRQGCHDTSMLQRGYTHGAVTDLVDCTWCHEPHQAAQPKMLVKETNVLCMSCHQLIRSVEGKTAIKDHGIMTDFYAKLHLPADMRCSFCHSRGHITEAGKIQFDTCSQCHTFLMNSISNNIHSTGDDYVSRKCTYCHDPHSAPYQHMLKKEPER